MSTDVGVALFVDGDDLDDDERAELTRRLRVELLALDVTANPALGGLPPAGAKAGDPVTTGALVLTFGPEVFNQVVTLVRGWLGRQRSRVKVEIDGQVLEADMSRAQLDAIVAAYLARVTAGR
jgi:hypothetical protein